MSNQSNDTNLSQWQQRKSGHKKAVKWLWAAFVIGTLISLALFILLSFNLPSFQELENPKSKLATETYTEDGVMLGKYFIENRTNIRYQDLPPGIEDALVSTEDERFYDHSGIDGKSLGRVLYKTILLRQESAGGGSTITQQLAKLLYQRPSTRGMNPIKKIWTLITTKFKEWLIAIKLERSYTKEEIITMYLNQFDFLYGSYGLKSASEIYFGKQPQDLTLDESAMFVGMLKNPTLYNPKRFMDIALNRRSTVLGQMIRNDKLTQAAFDTLDTKAVDLSNFSRVDHNDGAAPHFREFLRQDIKRILKNYPKPDGTFYDVYKDGLTIKTTLNSRMQQHAENAARDHLTKVQPQLFKHWKGMNPWTYRGPEESKNRASKEEIEVRQSALRRLVQNSERYQKKRPKYLKKAKELELRDVDVERLLSAEKDKKKITRWEKTNFIGTKLADKYREILRSNDWDVVKAEWEKFQDTMEKEFDKKTEMKVFSYKAAGETDTLMSPLDSIRYHRMHLQVGSIALDPKTGYIKAWVGGIDHKYFKYDHANFNVARQVGSTIKPFLYTLSIDLRGYSPCYKVMDSPVTLERGTFGGLENDWSPRNASEFTNQPITLQEGLRKSKNSVSAFLMKDLGSVEPFRNFLGNVNIDTTRVDPYPSICLGTPNLSVYEMTGAYTAFANEGIVTKPIYINSIEDKNGNIIYESVIEQKQVISEQANYVMLGMLKSVVGARLGLESEVGGKTGTTNSHTDAWFMGVTPNLVMGTWVGGDDRWIRFRELKFGQGAYLARPIFGKFMQRVEKDKALKFDKKVRFAVPERELEIELDCWKYAQLNLPGMTEQDMMEGDSIVGIPEGHPAYQGGGEGGMYPPGYSEGMPPGEGQVPVNSADEEEGDEFEYDGGE